MLSVSSKRRAIHAIVDHLTRDWIRHGGAITVGQAVFVAPSQQSRKTRDRHYVPAPAKVKEVKSYEAFSL